MKPSILTGLAALAAAAFLAGCGQQSDSTDASTPDAGSSAVAATKPYPLDVCLVSGEKLGSMGEPVLKVVDGQEVKFCCKDCITDFDKEPTKFLTKLAAK